MHGLLAMNDFVVEDVLVDGQGRCVQGERDRGAATMPIASVGEQAGNPARLRTTVESETTKLETESYSESCTKVTSDSVPS